MRELQLWDAAAAVKDTFDEIEALAPQCHFADCRHRDEPRCAVKAAVADGRIGQERSSRYAALMLTICSLIDPLGAATSTTSPFLWPSTA